MQCPLGAGKVQHLSHNLNFTRRAFLESINPSDIDNNTIYPWYLPVLVGDAVLMPIITVSYSRLPYYLSSRTGVAILYCNKILLQSSTLKPVDLPRFQGSRLSSL